MGHPTLSSEQIRQRNDEILAYADENPKATNVALGRKYGLSREAIRSIISRARAKAMRNQQLAEKVLEISSAASQKSRAPLLTRNTDGTPRSPPL